MYSLHWINGAGWIGYLAINEYVVLIVLPLKYLKEVLPADTDFSAPTLCHGDRYAIFRSLQSYRQLLIDIMHKLFLQPRLSFGFKYAD